MNSKVKKKTAKKFRYTRGEFSVVKFREARGGDVIKLFECIPDLWFVDEVKNLCYWPPKSKKTSTLRAMNQDEPEDDWSVYECELVSEGHVTYSIGSNVAREKVSQNYNTSSADEHIQTAIFGREHPSFIHKGQKCFESIFTTARAANVLEKSKSKVSDEKAQETPNASNKENQSNEDVDVLPNKKSDTSKHKERSDKPHSDDKYSSLRSNRSEDDSESRRNFSQPRSNHSQSQSNHSQSRSNHSQSSNHSKSRSNHSKSRSNHSKSRSNHSKSRSNHSQSRSSHSQSRSNHSQSRSNHSKSRSNHSKSRSNHSQSLSNHSPSRSNRSPSRSNHSKSRSNHSQSRSSHSQSRSNHSQSRSNHSKSRSNHSQSRSNHSQSRSNHSQSRSNHSQSRSNHSKSRSNHSPSRSNHSNSNYHQSTSRKQSRISSQSSNRSRHRTRSRSSHSHSSRNRSVSCREKFNSNRRILNPGNDHGSKSYSSSVKKTNRLSSTRPQLSSQTSNCMDGYSSSRSISNVRERKNIDQKSKARSVQGIPSAKNHVRQPENNSRSNNLLPSPRTRNRLRVDEMYRVHQQKRTANRFKALRNVQIPSSHELSPRRTDNHYNRKKDSPELMDLRSSNESDLLQTLVKEVKEIKKILTKNDRRFVESDRRLTRLEVTVNKTFIVLGDVSNAINARMSLGSTLHREDKPPKGFHTPKLPVKRLKELIVINKDLKNEDFFNFLVHREKEYCCYSNSTDTATMTAYLRRFIDVDLKAALVLKDLKRQQGLTLYNDFHNVYLFLIETMKAGYEIKNKILTNKEVHVVLRTVWGRSKQAAAEGANKRF